MSKALGYLHFQLGFKAHILALAFLCSCSMQKQLTEMHDTTEDLDQQTHELNQETKQVGQTSKDLSAKTDKIVSTSTELLDKTIRIADTSGTLLDKTNNISSTSNKLLDRTIHVSDTSDKLLEETINVGVVSGELKEISAHIAERTDYAATKMDHVSDTSDQVVKLTGTLLDVSKHGASLDIRQKIWREILDPQLSRNAQDIIPRLSRAGKYHMAFEYQLWSGLSLDSTAHRDRLGALAIEEFLRDIQGLYISDRILPNPMSDDPKEAALNVLATAMSAVDNVQQEIINADQSSGNPQLKPMTMLTLIKDSLSHAKEIQLGQKKLEEFPPFVKEVLNQENVALYLLKLRVNYLSYMGLGALIKSQLTPKPSSIDSWQSFGINMIEMKKSFLSQHCLLAQKFSSQLQMAANISEFNDEQLSEIARFLQGAFDTREFLKSIEIKAEQECVTKALFSIVDDSKLVDARQGFTAKRTALKQKISGLIKSLK